MQISANQSSDGLHAHRGPIVQSIHPSIVNLLGILAGHGYTVADEICIVCVTAHHTQCACAYCELCQNATKRMVKNGFDYFRNLTLGWVVETMRWCNLYDCADTLNVCVSHSQKSCDAFADNTVSRSRADHGVYTPSQDWDQCEMPIVVRFGSFQNPLKLPANKTQAENESHTGNRSSLYLIIKRITWWFAPKRCLSLLYFASIYIDDRDKTRRCESSLVSFFFFFLTTAIGFSNITIRENCEFRIQNREIYKCKCKLAIKLTRNANSRRERKIRINDK